jgi:hypothetical protein
MAALVGSPHLVAQGSLPMNTMSLDLLLATHQPATRRRPWSWDDEERDLFARECLCCGEPGHYQRLLEAHMAEFGLTEGVYLGPDGRVRDGHHRIVAARRLGIEIIPLETKADAQQRWIRDHGYVSWEERKRGDR